jgi:SAM-dependent methyltransferase
MQTANHEGVVTYGLHTEAEGRFRDEIDALVAGGAKRICDVGGGARPILKLGRIRKQGLDYIVLDESQGELDRSPGYVRAQGSILDTPRIREIARASGPFDAVITRWTAEHIPDGKGFHESVFELLRPGGRALHLFPTLYSVPFVINGILPTTISAKLLYSLFPRRQHKFVPFYSWCRGPSARQLERLRSVGFEIEFYGGYFGHDFYARVKPLKAAHTAVVERLVRNPRPGMTSFAVVRLRRPE